MENKVTLTMKEQHKLKMVIDYEAGKTHAQRAAELLGITKRQFRRIVAAYRRRGIAALAHGNRGRSPANRIPEAVRQEILRLAKETYRDYNDCHFTEELAEQSEPIWVSRSTLRRIRRVAGQGSPRKRRAPEYRSHRERYPQAGMMLQTDGSRHDWLEGRGPWLTLVGMIDDANNEVPGAVFREEEDAAGYFLVLEQVCMSNGIPQSIYADQHTIFQSPSQPTIEQELTGELPRTQFGRLVDELGIQLIAARKPKDALNGCGVHCRTAWSRNCAKLALAIWRVPTGFWRLTCPSSTPAFRSKRLNLARLMSPGHRSVIQQTTSASSTPAS
jgi:transposase